MVLAVAVECLAGGESDDGHGQLAVGSDAEVTTRYLLRIATTADCVVQTSDLQLIVGTDTGRLVAFDLNVLEQGQPINQPIKTLIHVDKPQRDK